MVATVVPDGNNLVMLTKDQSTRTAQDSTNTKLDTVHTDLEKLIRFTLVGSHTHVADLTTIQTITKPAGATSLLCQNTGTTNIRYTLDGTDPTSTNGMQLRNSADPLIIYCPGAAIEMIRESAGAALDYQWIREGSS
jgi:hypothetical protein